MSAKFIVSELGADTDPRGTMTLSTTSCSGLSTIDRFARAAFDGNAA
jgi:hypothetical protein